MLYQWNTVTSGVLDSAVLSFIIQLEPIGTKGLELPWRVWLPRVCSDRPVTRTPVVDPSAKTVKLFSQGVQIFLQWGSFLNWKVPAHNYAILHFRGRWAYVQCYIITWYARGLLPFIIAVAMRGVALIESFLTSLICSRLCSHLCSDVFKIVINYVTNGKHWAWRRNLVSFHPLNKENIMMHSSYF